jgi:hypothetical protein
MGRMRVRGIVHDDGIQNWTKRRRLRGLFRLVRSIHTIYAKNNKIQFVQNL